MNKLELYEKLGARKFQRIVFKVERLKYKLLKPWSNKVISFLDKRIDKKLDKILKRRDSKFFSMLQRFNFSKKFLLKRKEKLFYNLEEEELRRVFNSDKLRNRIEFNNEENRNYHLNILNVNETIIYLNINKDIHRIGIIYNAFWSLLAVSGMCLFSGVFVPIGVITLLYQGVSSVINFECINLQNYNILRLENRVERLEKIRNKRMEKRINDYGEAAKVVAPLLGKSKDLPKVNDILECLTTSEQLEQMRGLLDEVIREKESKNRKLKM